MAKHAEFAFLLVSGAVCLIGAGMIALEIYRGTVGASPFGIAFLLSVLNCGPSL